MARGIARWFGEFRFGARSVRRFIVTSGKVRRCGPRFPDTGSPLGQSGRRQNLRMVKCELSTGVKTPGFSGRSRARWFLLATAQLQPELRNRNCLTRIPKPARRQPRVERATCPSRRATSPPIPGRHCGDKMCRAATANDCVARRAGSRCHPFPLRSSGSILLPQILLPMSSLAHRCRRLPPFFSICTGAVFCCGAPGVLRPSATYFSRSFVRRVTISGWLLCTLVVSPMSAWRS